MNPRDRDDWHRDLDEREARGEIVDPREQHDDEQERLDRIREYAPAHSFTRDEIAAQLKLYPARRRVDVINVTAADRRAA